MDDSGSGIPHSTPESDNLHYPNGPNRHRNLAQTRRNQSGAGVCPIRIRLVTEHGCERTRADIQSVGNDPKPVLNRQNTWQRFRIREEVHGGTETDRPKQSRKPRQRREPSGTGVQAGSTQKREESQNGNGNGKRAEPVPSRQRPEHRPCKQASQPASNQASKPASKQTMNQRSKRTRTHTDHTHACAYIHVCNRPYVETVADLAFMEHVSCSSGGTNSSRESGSRNSSSSGSGSGSGSCSCSSSSNSCRSRGPGPGPGTTRARTSTSRHESRQGAVAVQCR